LTGGSSTTIVSGSSYTAGANLTQKAAAGAAVAVPLAAGAMVAGISAVCCGISNAIKYAKDQKKKTKTK